MSGHIVIAEVEETFKSVFKLLVYLFGNLYYNVFLTENGRIGLIVGEKWFFRTSSSTWYNYNSSGIIE